MSNSIYGLTTKVGSLFTKKGKFIQYEPLSKEYVSNEHLATFSDSEWIMTEDVKFGIAARDGQCTDCPVSMSKLKVHWKVFRSGTTERINSNEVFDLTVEGEITHVWLRPQVTSVRYRSGIVILAGFFGITEGGTPILLNLAKGAPVINEYHDVMQLDEFRYMNSSAYLGSNPSYVPVTPVVKDIRDMTMSEMKAEWESLTDANVFDCYADELGDDRLVHLQKAIVQQANEVEQAKKAAKEESSSTNSENEEESDPFLDPVVIDFQKKLSEHKEVVERPFKRGALNPGKDTEFKISGKRLKDATVGTEVAKMTKAEKINKNPFAAFSFLE